MAVNPQFAQNDRVIQPLPITTTEDYGTAADSEQVAQIPETLDIHPRVGESDQGKNATGDHLVVQHARSETAAVVTENAGAILREQVFLQVAISEEEPDTIEIQFFARREFIFFTLELPELDGEVPPTCLDRCCTGSRDPCHACTVKRVFDTENLKRARTWGIEILQGLLFPLFSRFGSELFSTIICIVAALSVAFSLPTFIRDAKENKLQILEIVRLVTSLVFLLLAIVDFAFSIRSCLILRAVLRCCSKKQIGAAGRQKQTVKGCCCKRPRYADIHPGKIIQNDTKEKTKWEKTKTFFKKYILDTLRVLIVESLTYPNVICDILDNASSKTYEGTAWEQFQFARFIFTAAKVVVLVYVVRLLVIGTTVASLEKIRRGGGFVQPTDEVILKKKKGFFSMFDEHNGKRRARKALVLEIFFLMHVFGQMLTQGLMLGAIWAKVGYENPNPTQHGVVFISPYTWTMIVLGFVLPIFGTFTFFISTYVWTQEFPLDFMITMLSALKKSNLFDTKKNSHEHVQKIESIMKKVEKDIGKRELNICFKIFFPFYTPHLAIISCLYDIVLLSFAVFFFVGQVESMTRYVTHTNVFQNVTVTTTEAYPGVVQTTALLYNYGWLLYYVIGVSLVNIANIIVVIIGLWWMVVVPVIWPALFIIICPGMCIWQAILKPIIKSCKERMQPETRSYIPNR